MRLTDHRVLITGGSAGIGLALAHAFHERGNAVLVAARDAARLAAAAEALPGLHTTTCDLTNEGALRRLVETARTTLSGLSLLINNAGVQYNDDYATTDRDAILRNVDAEIGLNLTGLVKLSALAVPLLREAEPAAIVNVSSVLAIAPKASAPVYCATKAAVRSFTIALRYQLEDAAPSIRVVEVLPPMVDTAMTRGRTGVKLSPERVAADVLAGLARDREEILIGGAKSLARLNRLSPRLAARRMRRR